MLVVMLESSNVPVPMFDSDVCAAEPCDAKLVLVASNEVINAIGSTGEVLNVVCEPTLPPAPTVIAPTARTLPMTEAPAPRVAAAPASTPPKTATSAPKVV